MLIINDTDTALTAQRLHELLTYDWDTGTFRRRRGVRGHAAGNTAGYCDPKGYLIITIDRHHYRAHRLAWLYVRGRWPGAELDHRNGNPADNRLSNLREATREENTQHLRGAHADCRSGIRGVDRLPGGRYRARIKHRMERAAT